MDRSHGLVNQCKDLGICSEQDNKTYAEENHGIWNLINLNRLILGIPRMSTSSGHIILGYLAKRCYSVSPLLLGYKAWLISKRVDR